ncbi:MAG TPA: site-2 protease family protein [Thermoanaerobaculia bacterium]|nr:site-2 protease family protein [Thermoanaerobaculia bacterium]
MFGRRFEILRLGGVPIYLDFSWIFLALLLTLSFATQVMPRSLPDQPEAVHWLLALAMTAGVLCSLLLHELAHLGVARYYRFAPSGVTLFLFGGVTDGAEDAPTPEAELLTALAGPFASGWLAGACGLVFLSCSAAEAYPTVQLASGYLAALNGLIACFNLLPAFPLDGGRVLRALLWGLRKDFAAATRSVSSLGAGLGVLMLLVGGLFLLLGLFGIGLLCFALGLFIRFTSRISYQSVVFKRSLKGLPVRHFLRPEPTTVSRAISLAQLAQEHFAHSAASVLPVVDGTRALGLVTRYRLLAVPREEWDRQSVGTITDRISPESSIGPDEQAEEALAKMTRNGLPGLLVVEGETLVGLLTPADLLRPSPPTNPSAPHPPAASGPGPA